MANGKKHGDLVKVLEELRERVRQRRHRLLSGGGEDGLGFSLAELRHSVKEIGDLSNVSAHLPISANGPLGLPAAFLKRVTRVLLRWYINPIVEQQNMFNAATVRAVFQVTAYEDLLTRELEAIERRLDELERAILAQTAGVAEPGA